MGAVLKWPLNLNDEVQQVGAGPVSLVACQDGVLTVWTHEPFPVEKRDVRVVGTGHSTPPGSDILGGALYTREGPDGAVWSTGLVFHVIAVPPDL